MINGIQSAINIINDIGAVRLIVTESIFIETLNYFAEFKIEAKKHAVNAVEGFSTNPHIEVIKQTTDKQEGFKILL